MRIRSWHFKPTMSKFLAMTFLFTLIAAPVYPSAKIGQAKQGFFHEVKEIKSADLGISKPAGLNFSQKTEDFVIMDADSPDKASLQVTDSKLDKADEKSNESTGIPEANLDPVNSTFDQQIGGMLILDRSGESLVVVKEGSDGKLQPAVTLRHNIKSWGLKKPTGMTVDQTSGQIFILDSQGPCLITVVPVGNADFEGASIKEVNLRQLGINKPQGLAFDPSTGHLHLFSKADQTLYEITQTGQLVATRSLKDFKIADLQSLVFGQSSDKTDSPQQMSLFLSDSGQSGVQQAGITQEPSKDSQKGRIIELSLNEPAAAAASTYKSVLNRTIDTSKFTSPSPDPTGIKYLPASNTLMISDSEVEEIPSLWANGNIFETTLSGSLLRTYSTLDFSKEPTDIAYNSANGHIFISDDDALKVTEVATGMDGVYFTADDVRTQIKTSAFGSGDPEGVAFDSDSNTLFIVDGINEEVYVVKPGANDRFDGVAPDGDDQVTSFDTTILGMHDPEGVFFLPATGHLYITATTPANQVAEVTTSGTLVQMIDTSAALAVKPSGLGFGPSSTNPSSISMYMTDRGLDNIPANAGENDGKVYELSIPIASKAPTVTITGPKNCTTYVVGSAVPLTGIASDAENGNLSTKITWTSSRDGVIGTGSSVTLTSLSIGTHTISASVTDSTGVIGSASIILTIKPVNSAPTVTITSPNGGTAYTVGDSISFSGSAIDAEDGNLGGKIAWTSSIDGALGTGSSFTSTKLSVGTHTITASVTDIKGVTGSTSVSITVNIFKSVVNRTIDTSKFTPPSPDPMSIEYLPASNTLLISDSEVEEMSNLWASANLFEVNLNGTLVRKADLTSFSKEPTGLAYNSANGHLFICDNDLGKIFEVTAGTDKLLGTSDDVRTSFGTPAFGCTSPRETAFDSASNTLFIVDNITQKVYVVKPGTNGKFDGVAPKGDDQVTNFDTTALGITAPQGVAFLPATSHLYISGTLAKTAVAEVTTAGTLVRKIDISAIQSSRLAGLGFGPSSSNPSVMALYVTDRGVDNNETATENDGKVYELSIPAGNNAPTVTITSPVNGAAYNSGQSITFTASASDAEDGNLNTSIKWTSSIDGAIGTGSSFTSTKLSAGTHIISASVTDSKGATSLASVTVSVTVSNNSPTVNITTPANTAAYNSGQPITFSGSASDTEDGNLGSSIKWTSSIDGAIGTGSSLILSTLSVGTHTITASVTDSKGATSSASIIVTVNTVTNSAPIVTITSPVNGTTYTNGQPITFTASAADTEDGNLSSSIKWASSIDGAIGTGSSFTLTSLSVGTHTISASVTDSKGATGLASVIIIVTVPNSSPTVTITSPANGTAYTTGQSVTFTASAGDAEDGNLSANIKWISSISGSIGSGSTFTLSTLSAGIHTITASVTDSKGATGSASVTITVNAPNSTPTVTITSPVNGTTYTNGQSMAFTASAADAEDGNLSSNIKWASSIDGAIGSGSSFTLTSLSVGTHTISASVTDSKGATGSTSVIIIVTASNSAPTITITSPANGTAYTSGQSITFTASASDTEDGNISANIKWTSSINGAIGSGSTFNLTSLSVGTHTIIASITDSKGATSSASIAVTVNPAAGGTFKVALNRTIDTSKLVPPSPDPMSIEYLPASNTILISDSEVEEMSNLYKNANLFEITLSGTLVRTANTTAFSKEPTGVACNTANGHIFVCDNDLGKIFEVDPGTDKLIGTSDDVRATIRATSYGCSSPRELAFDSASNTLFIVDNATQKVYVVKPGANGKFEGTGTYGDDQVTSFSTTALGITAPQGIAFLPAAGHLYISGASSTTPVAEVTLTGTLVQKFDISAAPSTRLAGIGFGPSSINPASIALYVTDRGVDNNENASENDGKVYELSTPFSSSTPTNSAPTVTINSPVNGTVYTSGQSVTFTASAADTEDGNLNSSIKWTSSKDGAIGNGSSLTLSTLSAGTHTISASVIDSKGASASASVTITVNTAVNSAPTVTITGPANGTSYTSGQSITFTGSASDAEDGNISANIKWTSSINGAIGTGSTFTLTSLSVGTHTISASITDSKGATGSASITVTVNPASGGTFKSVLNRTIDTSKLVPPSPDPVSIEYLPSSNTLLICDSEVEEMPNVWKNANLFEITLTGTLVRTGNTTAFSKEPTGMACNSASGHMFICDNDTGSIFDINPGTDKLIGTSDDVRTTIKATSYGCSSPRELAFDSASNTLFIVDNAAQKVYVVKPGANGKFEGSGTYGDDQVTSFSTTAFGITAPQGIAFLPATGHLYVSGASSGTPIAEVTASGALVQKIDISAAPSKRLAGICFGPSSVNPSAIALYVTDRGVDNNENASENDGKIYELSMPAVTP